MNWNEYFFRQVYLAASKSKDERTKIGAVLVRDNMVIGTGYNGICRGCKDVCDDGRHDRPKKYFFYEHAERNVIYACARHGINTFGSTLYTQGIPCADCARGVIQAGIQTVVVHKQWPNLTHSQQWVESVASSTAMFHESGVVVQWYDQILGLIGRLDGKDVSV